MRRHAHGRSRVAAALRAAAPGALRAGASPPRSCASARRCAEAFSFVPLDIGMQNGHLRRRTASRSSRSLRGRRPHAAGGRRRLDRHRARLRAGDGLHRQGLADQGRSPPWPARRSCSPSWCGRTARRPPPISRARRSASRPPARSPIGWSARPRAGRAGGRTASRSCRWARCPAQIAALKRGEIDGMIIDIGTAFELEKRGEGRILVRFGDIKDFHIHVIFATNKVIAEQARRAAQLPQGLVRDHRLHAHEQGRDGRRSPRT